jgi:hypothetical protein
MVVKNAESRRKIFERFGRFNPYPTHEGLESSWSSGIPVNDEHDNESSTERLKKKGKKGHGTDHLQKLRSGDTGGRKGRFNKPEFMSGLRRGAR